MTLDGITLNALVGELQILCGSKIEKIHQPERDEIVLLLHTLHKDRQEDSEAVFHIYQLPQGANLADYIDLCAEDLDENAPLQYMGTLTCRLVGEDASTVYNLAVSYIK